VRLFRVICLLLLACMLVFSQTGLAVESAPSYNWTGFYAGFHFGYGFGEADTNFTPLPNAATFFNMAPTKLSYQPDGVTGGVQVGYNYQTGCFVVGIEADFSGSAMSGSETVSPIIQSDGTSFPGPGFLRAKENINWFGTLRPRLGYTVTPTLLIYGTGGLAYGNVSYSATSNFLTVGTVTYPVSFNRTQVGWTLGAGVEYALAKNWSVKAEYLYMDLGSQSATANPDPANPPFQVGYKWETTANIVDIGLNYKF
jgi:outer membrane immunogenic protein